MVCQFFGPLCIICSQYVDPDDHVTDGDDEKIRDSSHDNIINIIRLLIRAAQFCELPSVFCLWIHVAVAERNKKQSCRTAERSTFFQKCCSLHIKSDKKLPKSVTSQICIITNEIFSFFPILILNNLQ